LKIHHKKMSGTAFPCVRQALWGIFAAGSLLAISAPPADAASIGGDSTTILRLRETGWDRDLYPLYEYLHLSGAQTDKDGTVSFHLGGWGRIDMVDSTTNRSSNGDVQYGFIAFDGAKNNVQARAGRQYITEGVINDKVDGLYLRSDFAMRFTAAAMVGSPAVTQPNYDGGDLIYGGRVAHSVPNLYTAGLSFLHTQSGSSHLREEEGLDLWIRPIKQVDLAGRSIYNSLTAGWNEHDYTATITPLEAVLVSLSLNKVDYKNYFHHVTTSALSVRLFDRSLDPREEMLSLGGNVSYTGLKNVSLSADYKHYGYDIMGDAQTWGLNAAYAADGTAAGGSYHRMDGSNSRLRYDEYRVYGKQKFGKADATIDFTDTSYDNSIQRIKNAYSFSAAAGYDYTPDLRVTGDIEYLRSVDFDEWRGMVKVVCAFGAERRGK
jgi:hypothetical protein